MGSTDCYFVCLSHDPPLEHGFGEIATYLNSEKIGELLTLIGRRGQLLWVERDYEVTWDNPQTAAAMHYFRAHPQCKTALRTEYNTWVDLGDGLPPGVKEWTS